MSSIQSSSHVVDVTEILQSKIENVTKECHHNPCIYEVPKNLRSVNPEPYTPFRVAIGPYHANYEILPCLKPMEQYKELYLSALISRKTSSRKLNDYVATISIKDLQTARQHYARIDEKFKSDKDLAAMLLTDSAFIVEFLCRVIEAELISHPGKRNAIFEPFFSKARRDEHEIDPIAGILRTHYAVCRDLILLENQVPYFILERVFELTFESRTENDPTFAEIAYHVLNILVPFKNGRSPGREYVRKRSRPGKVKHLLHLMWLCCLPFPEQSQGLTVIRSNPAKNSFLLKSLDIMDKMSRVRCIGGMVKYFLKKRVENDQILTATQLQEAGIRFKATKKHPNHTKALLANLSFSDGVVRLPCLILDNSTEMFFRNLMAFEQYYLNEFHITNYMYLVDSLIDTPNDVDILEECNVVVNLLESKDDATTVFNNISRHTVTDGRDFSALSKEIKTYARRPWNRWKAMLRRDYFATPWAVISFIAALILLGLTIVQTIASIRSVTW